MGRGLKRNWRIRRIGSDAVFRWAAALTGLFLAWSVWAQPARQIYVRIVEPEDGVLTRPGTNIEVRAEIGGVDRPDGIDFYRNTHFLGTAAQPPYRLVWNDVPAGMSFLTARLRFGTNTVVSGPVRVRAHYLETLFNFGLEEVEPLQRKLWGNPLWQYLASLFYLAWVFVASRLVDAAARALAKRFTAGGDTETGRLVIDLFKGPIRMISVLVLIYLGLQVYLWPIWVERRLMQILSLCLAGSLTYMALRFVDLGMSRWTRRLSSQDDRSIDEQAFPVLGKVVKCVVIAIAILATCQNVFHKDITTLLASLSIGGLAVGLAAQDTLSNLFGAMSIFVDKPFRLGDTIKLGDVNGVVESIGLRSTKVRSGEGYLITIPNRTMGNATITNLSSRSNTKTDINFRVPYELSSAQLDCAVAILRESFGKHPGTGDVMVSVNKFGESSVNILVSHTFNSTDNTAYLRAMQEMHLAAKKGFDEAGIRFATPARTVYTYAETEEKAGNHGDRKPSPA
jgi:MscS family membrane protein